MKKNTQVKSTKQLVRRYPRSGMDAFGRWASTYNWFGELEPNPTTDSLSLSFTNRLTETIHIIFPQKKVTRHRNDKPWITPTVKQLIPDRQKAFHCQNIPAWKFLKYKVQQEIKSRKTTYYKTEVKYLKKDDCQRWWKIVNTMAGKPEKNNFERDGIILDQSELANSLTSFAHQ
jgi:hypothetical protein